VPLIAETVERGLIAPSWASRSLALLRDYLALTKPRVIELLLVATIPVMLLAHRGTVDVRLILVTLFGGWLGAASANTLNCVVDADIDKLMDRTKNRPLARGAMSRRAALVFGLALGLGSFVWLWRTTNLLAAGLVALTIAFYVFVYTMFLKRRTSQNVVWGGAAGCMPALVGWAAVTGSLAWPALVVFLVIFFWTPPHTWSLAMKYREDYTAAGVPMLPTVADERKVARRMVWYTWATVATTLVLIPGSGFLYAGVAIAAGAWFLYEAHRLSSGLATGRPVVPFRLFLQSNNYLAAVFVGLAVDSALAWPTVASLL
jgi:protoheme IX farnesyltransferase